MLSDSASGPRFGRRALLRAGLTATVGTPAVTALLTACDSTAPDPLLPLLTAARTDVAAAKTLTETGAAAGTAQVVADVRRKHVAVLQHEVDRLNRPLPRQRGIPTAHVTGLAELAPRLTTTRATAVSLLTKLPTYRTALVGSIAAGCASLQQLDPELSPSGKTNATDPASADVTVDADEADQLDTKATEALQTALAAEYAAEWVYGLVTAYLPAAFEDAVQQARKDHGHLARRTAQLLASAGTEPTPRQAAYIPDESVTDEQSAIHTVITAETDTSRSWHGVLARTADHKLRTDAAEALTAAAARVTPWRAEGELDPVVVALPGRS